ncbi:MAG: methylenetetrahydrofolate--tRNA-(uracil(54)-C(5))-methyltransferase (FADH(2)-oxidizing) TrmFO, partial [Anaerolineaceae bacterium]|nr:methylenetetrahydrofolate--tRNA-(uracil(54)-C(5))-methyltransferase (FADH(2)-oxidizing) TrmFO [Anaerolineaceae bacterium]
GGALAVDRDEFSSLVTWKIQSHSGIRIFREEMRGIPEGPVVIASGPLTSDSLAKSIAQMNGEDHLYFYDAIAPIVRGDSIDMSRAFRASRYVKAGDAEGDYINCPLSREQYYEFVSALKTAERIELREFEETIRSGVKAGHFFEGCLPVEILADRGEDSLAFGPMRPVGLVDPHTGKRPYAVVQLRQDNLTASLFNLVGFQTNLKFPEQKRVFRLIPGLEQAEFERYGQMHRNTFIASPKLLHPTLQCRTREDLFFAGQITGVEGYMGNIATGLLAGINISRFLKNKDLLLFPQETMLGSLCHYITHASLKDFQPMKANFGILPPLESAHRTGKRERGAILAQRSMEVLGSYLDQVNE